MLDGRTLLKLGSTPVVIALKVIMTELIIIILIGEKFILILYLFLLRFLFFLRWLLFIANFSFRLLHVFLRVFFQLFNQQLICIFFELDYLILLALFNLAHFLCFGLLWQMLRHFYGSLFGYLGLALTLRIYFFVEHLIFILHLPETFLDNFDFVIALLNETAISTL